jgi:hypothetical protein
MDILHVYGSDAQRPKFQAVIQAIVDLFEMSTNGVREPIAPMLPWMRAEVCRAVVAYALELTRRHQGRQAYEGLILGRIQRPA